MLGSSVQRAAASAYPSRSRSVLRRRAVLGGLVLLSLVLITLSFRNSRALGHAEGVGASVLKPFQVAAERVAQPFRDTYGYFAGLARAKGENARLRREVENLRLQAIANQSAQQDVVDLRALLRYQDSPRFPQDFRPVNTRVISFAPTPFEQEIEIAAGSSSGIREHTPVVTGDGLVGLVTRVAHDQAQVTLLTDPNIKVSALDLKTGASGMVQPGQGRDTLAFTRVDKAQTLNEGDLVETSGWHTKRLTSLYPKGIAIGLVTGASQSEVDLYWRAQVVPRVDFDSLRSVLVLVPRSRGVR